MKSSALYVQYSSRFSETALITTGFVDALIFCDKTVFVPGKKLTCGNCGKYVWVNWGLTQPDHLSMLKNTQHCSHYYCMLKAKK